MHPYIESKLVRNRQDEMLAAAEREYAVRDLWWSRRLGRAIVRAVSRAVGLVAHPRRSRVAEQG